MLWNDIVIEKLMIVMTLTGSGNPYTNYWQHSHVLLNDVHSLQKCFEVHQLDNRLIHHLILSMRIHRIHQHKKILFLGGCSQV